MLSFFFFVLFIVHCTASTKTTEVASTSSVYFAYGSNLLKERLERSVRASRNGIGRIKDYRLDFGYYSNRWNGSVATVVPDPGKEVWVAVWKIPTEDLEKLDKQEGVAENVYKRINVVVELVGGDVLGGLTYMLTHNPESYVPLDHLPTNRQPSKAYMNVIIRGAEESGLPIYYKNKLKTVLHNNIDGEVNYDIL